jgi:hypothetical protein
MSIETDVRAALLAHAPLTVLVVDRVSQDAAPDGTSGRSHTHTGIAPAQRHVPSAAPQAQESPSTARQGFASSAAVSGATEASAGCCDGSAPHAVRVRQRARRETR